MIDTRTAQTVSAVNITDEILVKVAGPLIFIKVKLIWRLSPPTLEMIDTELLTGLIIAS